ncbi:MAG TPA: sodium-independent anion transporter, partial [Desulfobacteraceae bacterium]|nr:sodium-independent anion transporter [Desulfobacteraceae bacterium]
MITKLLPMISWFKGYNGHALKADFISGLTVALVLIPQSMAYAQLAGMPSYYGLYASFLPPMIAALFGSSRQLATGPVAVVSLMTSAALEPLATAGGSGYIAYALMLALMVGVFQFSLGVLRLGLVVNFLSHPVVNGFTNAAAIIIASSQLSKMFGVYVDKSAHHYETIINVIKSAFHYTHWPTLLMGALAFGIMYGLKKIAPRFPNVLAAVAVTTGLSFMIGFQHDMNAPVSSIASQEAVQLIANFNQSVNGISREADKRLELNKALAADRAAHDSVATLTHEHALSLVNLDMDKNKKQVHKFREQIRHLLFEGVEQADGSHLFFLKDKLPAGATGDGRTWRIKVGNTPLDTENLKMMGGGAVVGTVPKGLPAIAMPKIDFSVLGYLFPYAIIISLLGFMEAISIA